MTDTPVVQKGWLVIPESPRYYASACRVEYILGVGTAKDDDGDMYCSIELGNGINYKTDLNWFETIRELVTA